MALRDWMTKFITLNTETLATIATIATLNDITQPNVAIVATVAAVNTKNEKVNIGRSISRQDLINFSPPVIEGYKLSEILDHAEPCDYADLQNPEVLLTFTRALINSGKIISSHNIQRKNFPI